MNAQSVVEKKFREEKAIEVGNIFKLMNKYSKPF